MMIRTSLLVVAVAAAACSSPSPAPAPPSTAVGRPAKPDPLVAQIDAAAEAAIRDRKAVGLSIAVARGDQLVLAKGYGLADVDGKLPATADTVYRIGSVTKQLTAVLILQLVEQKRLALADDLRTFLPEYPTHGKRITIEQLLTHTSGIPSYTDVPDWLEIGAKPMTRAELLALFQDKPLAFAPGERWSYSNSNYYLLGLVIEKLTKQPYAEALRTRLFVPAGMTASAYCDDALPGHARGYRLTPTGSEPAQPLDLAHPYAAGAVCSTVKDMIAYQRALDTGKLLAPASLARMQAIAKLASGEPTGYGLGVFVGDLDGKTRVGHGGGINGFTAMHATYPADGLTIVVLANAMSDAPQRLEQTVARLALGLPAPVIKDEVLPAAERARYVGSYEIGGMGARSLAIRVFEDGDKLRLQATGQPAATLSYQGDATFVLVEDPDVKLVFAPGGGFTLHQGGMKIEATRTK